MIVPEVNPQKIAYLSKNDKVKAIIGGNTCDSGMTKDNLCRT